MFSDLLQYKRESFWEQHRIIQFDTLTAQAEYTVMAVFRGEAENLFAYYQFADAETPQEFVAYVDACKNAALYDTGVTAAYGDKLLNAVHLRRFRQKQQGGRCGKAYNRTEVRV